MQIGAITTTDRVGRDHENLEYSVKLDVYRLEQNSGVGGAIEDVWSLVEGDVGKRDRQTHRRHLAVLLANLFVAWKTKGNPFVAVILGEKYYAKGTRLHSLHLRRAPMAWGIEQLRMSGLVEHHPGVQFQNISRCTRIRATTELIDIFITNRLRLIDFSIERGDVVELRAKKESSDKGQVIDISRGCLAKQAKVFREPLHKLNEFIVKHHLRLFIDEESFIEHFINCPEHKKKPCSPPNPLAVKLHRVFNVTFECGGRFYGTWVQNIPKALRRHIRINGVPVQEIDYESLHPSLLYAATGTRLDFDPYVLPGYGRAYRPLFKLLLLVAINAENDEKAIQATRKSIRDSVKLLSSFRDCLTDKWLYEALHALKNYHLPIAEHIASGAGSRLQRIDSDMAETIMLDLMEQDILAIPIHDSFIVQNIHECELSTAMRESSIRHAGIPIRTELKYPENKPFHSPNMQSSLDISTNYL
ncbi:hypothetical protein [Pseudodesulfovibrio indicus]|uniref:DNA-directed DNA polymerase family A palm domain-containing protein n=2 Tax=Pseudodesulfovibrio indicus TaxID=1716143 RepID=A0ABN4M185_9BACT|nr:hypothetical protein [Pseudodesulfovibrio indicus]AMK12464.1 hypothetical protein AWY79_15825 [Pseudodesulfovibrio indicus]